MLTHRTPLQRQDALAQSAEARRDRAGLARQLKTGHLLPTKLFELVYDTTCEARNMRVSTVLRAMSHVGPVRAEVIRREAGIAGNRRLRGAGRRQRNALLELVARVVPRQQ